MEETITELIPDWCDKIFDVVLARNVDEYERKSPLPLLVLKTMKKIKMMYKTNRFCFAVAVQNEIYLFYFIHAVIDHGRRHSVTRTKSHSTRLRFVPYFLVLFRL